MSITSTTGLVPVSVLPQSWRRLFPYQHFNRMQSSCFDEAHGSDHSLVVAAPTGSGKTAVLEMAMVRLFSARDDQGAAARNGSRSLAVYLAPLKALTHERLMDWRSKLHPLSIVEMTGDSGDDESDERTVASADLILTTPEKWDSFSRFRRDAQGVIGRVALLLVDEVHTVRRCRVLPTGSVPRVADWIRAWPSC